MLPGFLFGLRFGRFGRRRCLFDGFCCCGCWHRLSWGSGWSLRRGGGFKDFKELDARSPEPHSLAAVHVSVRVGDVVIVGYCSSRLHSFYFDRPCPLNHGRFKLFRRFSVTQGYIGRFAMNSAGFFSRQSSPTTSPTRHLPASASHCTNFGKSPACLRYATVTSPYLSIVPRTRL